MGSTNKTANLELSQFLATDSPKWLTDYNADMEKIDVAVSGVKTQADATDLAVNGLSSTVTTLGESVSDQSTAIANLRTDVTGNTGSINTINSLIGNGTPTTTDKTLIGAINELHADISGSGTDIEAENIAYDNTTSGLSANNAQAAIDEVKSLITSQSQFIDVTVGTVSDTDATQTFTISQNSDNYFIIGYYFAVAGSSKNVLAGSTSIEMLRLFGTTVSLNRTNSSAFSNSVLHIILAEYPN